MLTLLTALMSTVLSTLRSRRDLALENLALRQQLAVLSKARPRPRLTTGARLFWVWLSRTWHDWASALVIVTPETVIRWHRKGFKLFWTWRSRRRRPGRPTIDPEIRSLILRMAEANPTWGAPRVHGELLKLGIEVSQRTVGRLMPRQSKPPSQTWRAFLDNHVKDLVSIDFFTVPTATFRVLFVLLVLAHDRRRVVHFNVTEHPYAEWTALQLVQAFPWDTAPRYMIRDRDSIFGARFRGRVAQLGIEEVLTAPRSPWQNPYVERLIGSIRTECLDQVIVLGEVHLRRILRSYVEYYHRSRTHLSLAKDAPEPREAQPPELGEVIALPQVGGLHHRYERRAA
jgi:transposase InsO family protein